MIYSLTVVGSKLFINFSLFSCALPVSFYFVRLLLVVTVQDKTPYQISETQVTQIRASFTANLHTKMRATVTCCEEPSVKEVSAPGKGSRGVGQILRK